MAITARIFGERGRRRARALGIDPSRLPPGQSPTLKWPVLSLGPTPRVETDTWLLSVDGAVEKPYVLDWDGLQAAPQADWTGDIHCVTRWSKFGMTWRGVAVGELLARAEPRADAMHLLAALDALNADPEENDADVLGCMARGRWRHRRSHGRISPTMPPGPQSDDGASALTAISQRPGFSPHPDAAGVSIMRADSRAARVQTRWAGSPSCWGESAGDPVVADIRHREPVS